MIYVMSAVPHIRRDSSFFFTEEREHDYLSLSHQFARILILQACRNGMEQYIPLRQVLIRSEEVS